MTKSNLGCGYVTEVETDADGVTYKVVSEHDEWTYWLDEEDLELV